MDPFLNIYPRLWSSMSSSDISYSSGASVTSTRDTSPDPPQTPRDAALLTRLEPCKLTSADTDMDRNAFHTVNDRRERHARFTLERGHQANIGRPLPHHSLPPRSLASTNWRASSTGGMDGSTLSPISPISTNSFGGGGGFTSPSALTPINYDRYVRLDSMDSNMRGGFLPDGLLDNSYSYCLDRGDGRYTRLVPVDMLPPLQGIPAIQEDASSMIVLPTPRMAPPNGLPGYTEEVKLVDMTVGQSTGEAAMMQRTDSTPQPPASPTRQTDIQSRIDSIVASSPSPVATSSKKLKIYCDKWIHDGTCAFTQQGCKYKHEMPADKETQEKLGLFHGYPAWWKKLQADRQRPIDTSNEPVVVDSNLRIGHPAHPAQPHAALQPRRLDPPQSPEPASPAPFTSQRGGFGRGNRAYHSRFPVRSSFSPSPYGPIAPPSKVDTDAKQEVMTPLSLSGSVASSRPISAASNHFSILQSLDFGEDTATKEDGGAQGTKLH